MKRNMGISDRVVRLLIAATIGALYFADIITGTLGLVLLIAGGIFALTSFVSFCPLYAPFGIRTCRAEQKGA